LRFGSFRLDAGAKRLWCGEDEVILTPKAFDVLYFLATHAGEVVTREQLLAGVWPGSFVDDHALSVQIGEVRKALDDHPKNPRYIETRHRRGYRFIALVEGIAAASMEAETERGGEWRPPVTRYARSGDIDIAYQVLGDGPIDLVFVMGWVSHLEYFWKEPRFARFLRRLAGFARLILFDKRGTGLSDRVPIAELPTLEERMDDVRAVMDAAGSQRAVLCGVSEGGPMSALFAATYPEKTLALVMIGTYAKRLRDETYPWGPTEEERAAFFEEIHRGWGGPVGIEQRAPSLASDEAFREWWATYLRMGASPGAAVALTKMNAEIDVRQVLPSIRVPALVLHRRQDQTLKFEEGQYVARLIPQAQFIELPGEDHLPFVGDQDGILDAMENFLREQKFGDRAERVLATILAMDAPVALRGAVEKELGWFRGQEIDDAIPEGLAAAFDGPARAVRCGIAIARRASRMGVTIRAAVHTGECDIARTGITGGPALDAAREIQRLAGPGEVLISSAVRDLVAGSGLEWQRDPRSAAERPLFRVAL
jgi:pimeloyl-ACP methyl ester carboxylesterase